MGPPSGKRNAKDPNVLVRPRHPRGRHRHRHRVSCCRRVGSGGASRLCRSLVRARQRVLLYVGAYRDIPARAGLRGEPPRENLGFVQRRH